MVFSFVGQLGPRKILVPVLCLNCNSSDLQFRKHIHLFSEIYLSEMCEELNGLLLSGLTGCTGDKHLPLCSAYPSSGKNS